MLSSDVVVKTAFDTVMTVFVLFSKRKLSEEKSKSALDVS